MITGVSGRVREAIEQFESGVLPNIGGPSVQSHFGMSKGGGMGRGRGMGKR